MQPNEISPFLRWAGGKNWLIKHIHRFIPSNGFNNYYEPFLGGGSIFFSLKPKQAYLSDLNEDLILTYLQIRDNLDEVQRELTQFKNTKEYYYFVRDEKQFHTSAGKAAKFIFLNQTSFNGIFRVNLKGNYNVPYGYRKKDFYQPQILQNASAALQGANLTIGDFMLLKLKVKEGDLVFLDPPYTVSHYDNGFIKYNSRLFSEQDQKRLSSFIKYIKRCGAYYILTNAAHDQVLKIFLENGDPYVTLERASLIGGKNAKRGIYKEAVFTNAPILV